MRKTLSGRAVYVGCRRCGETDKQLRRAADGELYCPACYAAANVPESGTKTSEEMRIAAGGAAALAMTGTQADESVGLYKEDSHGKT